MLPSAGSSGSASSLTWYSTGEPCASRRASSRAWVASSSASSASGVLTSWRCCVRSTSADTKSGRTNGETTSARSSLAGTNVTSGLRSGPCQRSLRPSCASCGTSSASRRTKRGSCHTTSGTLTLPVLIHACRAAATSTASGDAASRPDATGPSNTAPSSKDVDVDRLRLATTTRPRVSGSAAGAPTTRSNRSAHTFGWNKPVSAWTSTTMRSSSATNRREPAWGLPEIVPGCTSTRTLLRRRVIAITPATGSPASASP